MNRAPGENSQRLKRSPNAMNRLIAIITGLHVLAHGVLGCCGDHNAHAATASHCCHTAKQHACSGHAAEGHNHESADSCEEAGPAYTSDSSERSHHDCPHAACQWLDTKAFCPNELFQLELNHTAIVTASVLVAVSPSNTGITRPDDSSAHPAALPLRLHLAMGVLLI